MIQNKNSTGFEKVGMILKQYQHFLLAELLETLLCSSDLLAASGTVRRIVMWLFCLSLPTRLLIPARDQRFQRESDPHMMHIIHHAWQTLKSCTALKPA